MTDIIERLRIESRREAHEPIWRDAIDEIEALRVEVERVTCELMDATTRAERDRLVEALECMIIGACAVAVPHNGERAVLQDAVNIARAALAAHRKQGDEQ